MNHPNAGAYRHMRHRLTSLIFVTALVALALPPLAALAQTAPEPIQVSGTPVLISGGPGNQTDPHISGTLVSYTHSGSAISEIRYHDLDTGADSGIPQDTHRDSLSDVSGTTIVFRRVYTDGSTSKRPIMAFDTANPAGMVELDPMESARRRQAEIGGRTVVWEEQVGVSSSQTDIVAHDLDTDQTVHLTTDGIDASNQHPAVSLDGSVITWMKCATTGTSCDIYAAHKQADGTWGAAVPIGDAAGEEILPSTNGQIISYASNAGGDFDIRWVNVDGTGESQISMPGTQSNPNMSGNLIAFESEEVGSTYADLFVYDLATGLLYQVTNTPDTDEVLNDISVGADGTVWMVWAQPDGIQLGDNDVYALSFELVNSVPYEICPLFDQSKSYRVKSTVPIQLQLCDAQGQNLSSASLVVTATDLVKKDGTASPTIVEDTGNANPDNNFRYDAELGDTGGYIYNLSTKGLSAGTWELRFTVSGDTTTYGVRFDLR